MINRVKNNIKSEFGGATMIYMFLLLFIVCLMAIFIFDYNKMQMMENRYRDMAQRSVQVGIKKQNSIGGLDLNSANAVVEEYLRQRNVAEGHASKMSEASTKETSSFRKGCDVGGKYPEIEITYDTGRRLGTKTTKKVYTSVGGKKIPISEEERRLFNNHQYSVIQVKIKDVTSNTILGMLGKPCTEFNIINSAITSSAYDQEDAEKD